jgi:hypothetical protein
MFPREVSKRLIFLEVLEKNLHSDSKNEQNLGRKKKVFSMVELLESSYAFYFNLYSNFLNAWVIDIL